MGHGRRFTGAPTWRAPAVPEEQDFFVAATVNAIYRYPVKGLSGEALGSGRFDSGAMPARETAALPLPTGRFSSGDGNPHWMEKNSFLMLAKDEKLAQLRVRFDDDDGTLTVLRDGKAVVTGKPGDAMGRMLIGQFFASFMAASLRGAAKFVAAEGVNFTDVPEKYISIINLASVADLERVARQPADPLRFRGNLYLEGLAPWSEADWIGQTLEIGDLRLEVVQPIGRCAATNVNPETAERDMNIPLTLRKGFGHKNMGVLRTGGRRRQPLAEAARSRSQRLSGQGPQTRCHAVRLIAVNSVGQAVPLGRRRRPLRGGF